MDSTQYSFWDQHTPPAAPPTRSDVFTFAEGLAGIVPDDLDARLIASPSEKAWNRYKNALVQRKTSILDDLGPRGIERYEGNTFVPIEDEASRLYVTNNAAKDTLISCSILVAELFSFKQFPDPFAITATASKYLHIFLDPIHKKLGIFNDTYAFSSRDNHPTALASIEGGAFVTAILKLPNVRSDFEIQYYEVNYRDTKHTPWINTTSAPKRVLPSLG